MLKRRKEKKNGFHSAFGVIYVVVEHAKHRLVSMSLTHRQRNSVISGAVLWLSSQFSICLNGTEPQAQSSAWSNVTWAVLHFPVLTLLCWLTVVSAREQNPGARWMLQVNRSKALTVMLSVSVVCWQTRPSF